MNEESPLPKSSSANSQPMPCSTAMKRRTWSRFATTRALGDLEADVARVRAGVIEAIDDELEEFGIARASGRRC